MTKTCYIMVGVSGAGKSTAMRALASTSRGTVKTFSLDDCRLSFFFKTGRATGRPSEAAVYGAAFDHAIENPADFNNHVNKEWNEALKADTLFVDNTNLTRKSRARWIQEARQKGFSICAVEVHAPLQTVIDRQGTRGDKSVPAAIVRDMYMRQQAVLLGSEADFILHVDGLGVEPTTMTLYLG